MLMIGFARSAKAFTAPLALYPRTKSPTSKLRMVGSILDLLSGGGGKGGGGGLIAPADALPGRTTKMPNIDGLRHAVLGNDLTTVPDGHQVAVYGSGCFWGSEKGQWRFPQGIYSTAVGYCAGFTKNPTYEEACSGRTGHTEAVRVVYDPALVSYVDVLRWFWESHDPCSGMGQGNDRGTQYRSGLYYFNDEQRQLIEASREAYQKALIASGRDRPITTEIAAASDYDQYGGLWYFAEPYHQQYLAKPGARPYCSAQPQGVSLPPYEQWSPFAVGSELYEKHRPTLPESFWSQHGPKRGCSVVSQPNEPIEASTY
jgi:peptide-methionine (S)-S-oxide reductase